MSLNKILDEQVITTNINAKDKNEALLILSEKLLSAGYINDINSFLEDIYYRESLGATGIGNYIAIPHGQSDSVLRNGIAIGFLMVKAIAYYEMVLLSGNSTKKLNGKLLMIKELN
jgi:Phosphotransferase system mannitol/fructose-specific IIA domain (Ntr-type)